MITPTSGEGFQLGGVGSRAAMADDLSADDLSTAAGASVYAADRDYEIAIIGILAVRLAELPRPAERRG